MKREVKQKYKATIFYTIDATHPDIKYLNEEYNENKVFNYSDIYSFPADYAIDYCMSIIKSDLRLVAGGGYNSEHIHNVTFNIEKMEG